VADVFTSANIEGVIEPIRSAEVSFCHTVEEGLAYIKALNHPSVQHINGDVYHMQSEESHIGEAILRCDQHLVNLHLADSNRCALGEGSLDLDTIIMALYIIGYNGDGCFVTPESLGAGKDKPIWLPVGKGEVNFKGQLQSLEEDDFQGVISIETHYIPEGGFAEDGIRESFAGMSYVLESL